MRQKKRESIIRFCEEVEKSREVARVHNIFAKEEGPGEGSIRMLYGEQMIQAPLDLEAHFPVSDANHLRHWGC